MSKIKSVSKWQGSRRAVVGAGAGLAVSMAHMRAFGHEGHNHSSPVASPATLGSAHSHLVVADANDDVVYVYSFPGFELTGTLDQVRFGIHGGALQLEDGRLLFADTLNEEIVALRILDNGTPEISDRVGARLGGGVTWISANPEMSHLVVGSLIDEAESQFLNIVDLGTFENTTLEFAMAAPEEIHGWLLGDPMHVHVAVGGQIDSYLLSDLVAGNTTSLSSVPVELGSHGGVTDGTRQRIFYTTGPGTGFEVLDASEGAATFLQQVPWDVDGFTGGRNARPRVLADGVHVMGVMTPGLEEPSQWAETEVTNHITNMETLEAARLPVDVGTIGYRWGLAEEIALWAGYNADGARAYIIDAVPDSPSFGTPVATVEVTMPGNAAVPGEDYNDSEFYLMTAVSPDGAYGFVTISGDGLIQVIDLATQAIVADIQVPSALAGGGYTTVVQPGVVPVDLWAR
jgi:hypothetical protein